MTNESLSRLKKLNAVVNSVDRVLTQYSRELSLPTIEELRALRATIDAERKSLVEGRGNG